MIKSDNNLNGDENMTKEELKATLKVGTILTSGNNKNTIIKIEENPMYIVTIDNGQTIDIANLHDLVINRKAITIS